MLTAKCLLRLAIVLAIATPSFAREWHITRFVSNITVTQDGGMEVREYLVVDFKGYRELCPGFLTRTGNDGDPVESL